MEKKLIWLLCLFFVFGLSSCCMKSKKVARVEDRGEPIEDKTVITSARGELKVGEKYNYKVGWMGLDVGIASLLIKEKTVIDNKEVYVVTLEAHTNRFFSVFYNVKLNVTSYLDINTHRPVKHDSMTKVNKKVVLKKIDYNFDTKIAYCEDKKGNHEIAITDDVLDPLGVFYYFTLNEFNFNEKILLNINGGKKNFSVTVFASKIRRVAVPAGRFEAFLVEPTIDSERQFDDVLKAQGRMRIWFSADERRIPLLISLKVPVGAAKAVLTSIKVDETVAVGSAK